ncbi:MAG: pilus assembly protein PilM [Pontiella sp.]
MRNDRIIALDIGTDGIRMAVVSSGTSVVHDSDFVAYVSDAPAELPQAVIVAMTLKRLMEGRKPRTKRARISIEGQSVFSRIVKLPRVGRDQLEKTIRHEAVQNIPFPINKVVWDAYVIDPKNPEPDVLLVAVKVELVEGLVHAVSANGLAVERVSVAPVALANALHASGETDPLLMVDAGDRAVNLIFVAGARIFFRTFPIAEQESDRLVQEIERSISFYQSQQQGRGPERILTNRAVELSGRFSMPVEPMDHISVCLGLAAEPRISIDLIPASLQQEQELKRRQPLWFVLAILLMLILGVWMVNIHLQTQYSARIMSSVERQVGELSRMALILLPLEARLDELNDRAEVYRAALEQRTLWLETLGAIRGLLPEGMFVLSSEPLRPLGQRAGIRITVVSYLDKEPKGQDAVKLLRDALRSCERFSKKTKVFSRPSKKLFARGFVLDVYFLEEES